MPELDLGNVKGPQGKSAYQSALDAGYSGSEEAFNTAMAKAPDAVLYTPQTLSDEQKAQARGNINAAPGGHGLGDTTIPEAPDNDANKIATTGWYMASVNVPTGGWWLISSITYGDVKYQFAYANENASSILNGTALQRSKKDASVDWTPWEWVNPPMTLGVEYRTTERHLGKPVYVKVVDFGSCPASGYKDVSYGDDGIVLPIRCEGTWSYAGRSTIPFEASDADQLHIGALGGRIRVKTGGKDFSGFSCTATVYYTKSTD